MKTYDLSFIEMKHEKIAYRKTGTGEKVLLLIHGNMTSSAHFNILMDRLETRYTIYAPDLRGFGQSTYNNRIDSLSEFSDDIFEFSEALGLNSFELLGWSTGGGVALDFAARYNDKVSRLILLESVGITGYPMFKKDESFQPIMTERLRTKEEIASDPIQVAPVLEALRKRDKTYYRNLWNMLIYNSGNQPDDESYEYYLEDMLTQRNLVDVDYALVHFNMGHVNNGVIDGSGMIEEVKAPIDLIQGKNDLVVPMDMAMSIYEAKDKTTNLHIIENSGHNPLIDALDQVVEIILQ